MAETSSAPPPSTDNWPFLYMERPHLPTMYWLVMGIFVACGLLAVAATGQLRRQSLRMHAPFLFMGAAFFLLETRSLIEFALLFGATWLVNALVFTAILVSVLLANILVMRWRGTNVVLPFLLLAAALAAQLLAELEGQVARLLADLGGEGIGEDLVAGPAALVRASVP